MRKIMRYVSIILSTLFVFSSSVLAKPAENVNVAPQNESIETNIEMLDNQIEDALRRIGDNKNKINQTQKDIKNLEKQIKNTESDIDKHTDILKERVRASYMSGADSYIEIILESKNFEDFISKIEAIQKIISFDNKAINDLKSQKASIASETEKLKNQNNNLTALLADNEKKLDKLNKDKNDEKKLLAQTEQNSIRKQGQQKTYALGINPAISTSLSRGAVSISSNSVVNYAYNFLGTPYVWGGTNTSGFDCSGFTQYVYAHFGVGLGRTTYQQINDGTPVSRDQLQPGDLVLFGSSSNPHHVGIYIGNGMYIHAPHTGDVVKISPLSRNDYLTARRVK